MSSIVFSKGLLTLHCAVQIVLRACMVIITSLSIHWHSSQDNRWQTLCVCQLLVIITHTLPNMEREEMVLSVVIHPGLACTNITTCLLLIHSADSKEKESCSFSFSSLPAVKRWQHWNFLSEQELEHVSLWFSTASLIHKYGTMIFVMQKIQAELQIFIFVIKTKSIVKQENYRNCKTQIWYFFKKKNSSLIKIKT